MRLKIVNAKSPSTTVIFSGVTIENITASGLSQPRDMVVVNGNDSVAVVPDNLTSTMPYGILGFIESKPGPTTATILLAGKLSGFVGLVAGSAYFVSPTGTLTTAAPLSGTVQQVGIALNTTTLIVNILQPFRRS